MSQIPPYQMGSPEGGAPPKQKSKSVWIWVVVGCAGMCVVCGIVGAAVMVPAFAQARQVAKDRATLSLAKRVSISVQLYTSDNDDRFPPFDNGPAIVKRLEPYLDSVGHTSVASKGKATAAMKGSAATWNKDISAVNQSTIKNPDEVWMFTTDEPVELNWIGIGFADYRAVKVLRKEVSSRTAMKPIFNQSK